MQKNISTTAKILKTLFLMVKNPVSIDEILSELEKEDVFITKETVSKYFATLRQSGCQIKKKRNKFYINYPVLNLASDEFYALANFHKSALKLTSKQDRACFLKFLDKIFALMDKPDTVYYHKIYTEECSKKGFLDGCTNSKTADIIETISDFTGESPQKLKITCDNTVFNVTPLDFRIYKGRICLLAHDNAKSINRLLPLDKILKVERTPAVGLSGQFGLATTFKLTGRLKNAYILKEGETAADWGDYMIITNKSEDKDALFTRLLRYGTYCEIISPEYERKEFKNMLETLYNRI